MTIVATNNLKNYKNGKHEGSNYSRPQNVEIVTDESFNKYGLKGVNSRYDKTGKFDLG